MMVAMWYLSGRQVVYQDLNVIFIISNIIKCYCVVLNGSL